MLVGGSRLERKMSPNFTGKTTKKCGAEGDESECEIRDRKAAIKKA